MLLRSPPLTRRAAALTEAALVYPIVILLTIGMVIVALGVYDYLQVTAAAREGARWASVHGGQYKQETGNAMATPSSVFSNAIAPKAVGLDPAKLNATVTWADPGEMPTYVDTHGNVVSNQVTVTVTYTWTPALYLSPMTFTSTCVMTMQY
jgi:Flp pilus assembly protein TadG